MKRVVAAGVGAGLVATVAGRLLHLERQVGRYSARWAHHNTETLRHLHDWGYLSSSPDFRYPETGDANDPFTILGLGDSSVQGIGAGSITRSLLPLFAGAVRRHLGEDPFFVNFSISGEEILTLANRQIASALGADLLGTVRAPCVTIMCVGGNDVMNKDVTTEDFASAATEVALTLPEGSYVGNIPSFAFLPQEKRAAEFSEILEEEMSAAGHHIVDIRGFSQSLSVADYVIRYHAADLFHPNSRAYDHWARLFFEKWLEQNGEAGSYVTDPLPLRDSSDGEYLEASRRTG